MASVAKREWTYRGQPRESWVVRYTDQGGKRRLKTFDKKKDADKYRTQVEAEIERGDHVADSETMTVAQATDAYLNFCEDRHHAGKIGLGHVKRLRSMADTAIIPGLGRRKLTELTFNEVEEWYRGMTKKIMPVTAKEKLCLLSKVEAFAVKRGLTKLRVAKQVSEEVGSVKSRVIRTFTLDEVRRVIELAEHRKYMGSARGHLFMKCAVQLAAFCGLRAGEIKGLTLESVDLSAGVLKIRHSLTVLDELKGPKTKAGNRDVPLPERVATSLKEWREKWYVPNGRLLLFRMKNGSEITAGNFHLNYWRPLLRQAGLEFTDQRFHFHALRHFSASLMIEMGLPLTEVASLLGHETFDMTLQVYAHPIVGGHRRHESFERISAALSAQRDNNATTDAKRLISHV